MNTAAPLDETTMKCGLLLETAQTQQQHLATGLQELREHTRGLDGIVRAEIRQTLIDELGAVVHESERAVQTLRALERHARLRFLLSTLVTAILSGASGASAATMEEQVFLRGTGLPVRATATAVGHSV